MMFKIIIVGSKTKSVKVKKRREKEREHLIINSQFVESWKIATKNIKNDNDDDDDNFLIPYLFC